MKREEHPWFASAVWIGKTPITTDTWSVASVCSVALWCLLCFVFRDSDVEFTIVVVLLFVASLVGLAFLLRRSDSAQVAFFDNAVVIREKCVHGWLTTIWQPGQLSHVSAPGRGYVAFERGAVGAARRRYLRVKVGRLHAEDVVDHLSS